MPYIAYEDMPPAADAGLLRRASMLETENEQLRVALRNLVGGDWYVVCTNRFQGVVSGDALDAAKRLVERDPVRFVNATK